jgi:hypothetical protein
MVSIAIVVAIAIIEMTNFNKTLYSISVVIVVYGYTALFENILKDSL